MVKKLFHFKHWILLGALPFLFVGRIGTSAFHQSGIEKFVDELPIPPRIKINDKDAVDIKIPLQEVEVKFHRDLPPMKAWGYKGASPGPTIEINQGTRLRVHWVNQLPTSHIFPMPQGFMNMGRMPDVRAVTHLHGEAVSQLNVTDKVHNNDGWPDLWTVAGEEQIAEYPNNESARTLWYHDHAMASTGRNVAAGLLGMYIIHDQQEKKLNLPVGKYDVPLIFQGQGFNADGSRYYTEDIANEFYGNSVTVNGKLYPYMNVEPRKYRFRILDASNARSYSLKLIDESTETAGPPLYQIGVDGGFLPETAVLNDPADSSSPRLVVAPGERADVIIDFSHFAGKKLILHNNSVDPGDGEIAVPQIMEFRVASTGLQRDMSSLPAQPGSVPLLDPVRAITHRKMILSMMPMGSSTMMMINNKDWTDEITETPVLGTTEVWELVNTTTSMHPFHIHLVNFQILDNRAFDVEKYTSTGEINYIEDPVLPDPNQRGWKDVVQVQPGTVTRIIIPFGPYPGYYVYHCHILEHEDMDMMRPFKVIAFKPN